MFTRDTSGNPFCNYLNFARIGGFQLLINFHEEPLCAIILDASSRKAGQDSGINTLGTQIPWNHILGRIHRARWLFRWQKPDIRRFLVRHLSP
jgi:hypothetical protein